MAAVAAAAVRRAVIVWASMIAGRLAVVLVEAGNNAAAGTVPALRDCGEDRHELAASPSHGA
ncbi:hypothetical protein ACWDA3_55865 [Nonomuraea rubra]